MAANTTIAPADAVKHERLLALLDYDPLTGVFVWRITPNNRVSVGAVAGTPEEGGYVRIQIDGRPYLAHRLAWFYVHGVWPVGRLDHKDVDPSHNWIDNLREATHTQNMRNRRMTKRCKTGFRGVYFRGSSGRFVSIITIDKRQVYLGSFASAKDASIAYEDAAQFHFGEFYQKVT